MLTRRIVPTALLAAAALCLVAAAPHHHLKQEFFVCDADVHTFIVGATITVSYDGVSQEADTDFPHGNVSFTVPGEVAVLDVTVSAAGYATVQTTVSPHGRPHVGGKGYWIELPPIGPAQ